jgi:hypothetical protein
VTVFKIRYEGPAALAMGIARSLADAEGVDLTSSAPPTILNDETVQLDLSAEGPRESVTAAVAGIRKGLPSGASIDFA